MGIRFIEVGRHLIDMTWIVRLSRSARPGEPDRLHLIDTAPIELTAQEADWLAGLIRDQAEIDSPPRPGRDPEGQRYLNQIAAPSSLGASDARPVNPSQLLERSRRALNRFYSCDPPSAQETIDLLDDLDAASKQEVQR